MSSRITSSIHNCCSFSVPVHPIQQNFSPCDAAIGLSSLVLHCFLPKKKIWNGLPVFLEMFFGDHKSGSTISTLLHDKINPKDCQASFVGDSGFLQFFRVVSSDDKANPTNPSNLESSSLGHTSKFSDQVLEKMITLEGKSVNPQPIGGVSGHMSVTGRNDAQFSIALRWGFASQINSQEVQRPGTLPPRLGILN